MRVKRSERGRSEPRTLETLKNDYQNFINSGANIKNAKFFKNVIEECMFDIPIDQVKTSSYSKMNLKFKPYYYFYEKASLKGKKSFQISRNFANLPFFLQIITDTVVRDIYYYP